MKFYKLKEVADMLGLNYLTIYRYISTGELKASKLGRVYRVSDDDLKKFIEKRTVNPKY